MADITITAANVRPGSTAPVIRTAGETVTAGQSLYKKTSDGKYYLTDANLSAEAAAVEGIAITNASADELVLMLNGGEYTVGGTVVVGEVYVASATAGGIAPASDGASGWYTSIIGVGKTTSTIEIAINVTGSVRA